MDSRRLKSLTCLYLVALLWGSTGVWSRISTLPSSQIVTGRTTIAALALLFLVARRGRIFHRANWLSPFWLLTCAVILGLHWYCFFECMREASVALGLITYTTCPVFTALAEPILLRQRISARPLGASLLALLGIWFVHPVTSLHAGDLLPTLIGITAGLLMAGVALISRYKLLTLDAAFLSFSLNGAIALGSWLIAPITLSKLTMNNVIALAGLGILCSALGQSLFIAGMRHVDSRTSTLIATLEAPSGVFLAWTILGEPLSLGTISGCLLVIAAVLLVQLHTVAAAVRQKKRS